MMPEHVPQSERQALGESILPEGAFLAIQEPFFKTAADGGPIVRVDDPREVSRITSLGPSNAEDWKKEGNVFFRSTLFSDALRCYNCALNTLCNQSNILPLLLNLSNTYFRLEDGLCSLVCAGVALSISDSNGDAQKRAKSFYRVGLALSRTSGLKSSEQTSPEMFREASGWFKREATLLGMDAGSVDQVVTGLVGTCSNILTSKDSA
eukprot:2346339-Rhodomonas_salina.1